LCKIYASSVNPFLLGPNIIIILELFCKHPHVTKTKHTLTHILQGKFKQTQYKKKIKYTHYNQVPSVNGHHNMHVNFVPKNFIVSHFRSLNIKTKSLHIYLTISPKSLPFTLLHLYTLNPHLNSLACNYILNPLSNSVYFIW